MNSETAGFNPLDGDSGNPRRLLSLERAFATSSVVLGVVCALVALIAIFFVDHVGTPIERAARVAVPCILAVITVVSVLIARRGRFRIGVHLYVWIVAISIFAYVTVSHQGVYGLTLAFLAPLIIAATYLLSIRAGIIATALFSAGAVALFFVERHATGPSSPAYVLPETNALVVWLVLFALCCATSVAYRMTFDRLLRIARQNEERFRLLFGALPEPCYLHRDLVVIAANEACARFNVDGNPRGIVGRSIQEIFPADPKANFEGRLELSKQLKPGESLPPSEFTANTNDSRRGTFLAVTRKVLLDDGEALLTLLVDVTQDKQMREMLLAAQQRAEFASSAKSKFLADMSHEIRTPLNAIIGLTELARSENASHAARMRYLELVSNAGESLLGLLSRVLDLAKIESGQMHADISEFNLRNLLQSTAAQHRSIAKRKGLSFAFNISSDLPERIVGDEARLKQVFNNLLDNAIKFTEEGGVSFEADLTNLGLLRVRVSDTGVGVSDDERAHLFKPFSQANDMTHHRYGGTGLGLALCRELMTLMGGQISATSRVGKGSQFVVEFPLIEPPEAEGDLLRATKGKTPLARQPEMNPDRMHEHTVLVVEDHHINQLVVTEMLRELGVAFELVSNKAEAINAADERPFSLILMDIRLPDGDGYEAAREIRNGEKNSQTPMIAFTASAFAHDQARALDAGMNDLLIKPVTRAALVEMLVRWQPARASSKTGRGANDTTA